MKNLLFTIFVVLGIAGRTNAQTLPFTVGEISTFKTLILNGNNPTNINFTCEYVIDEKASQWGDIPKKEIISICNNAKFIIRHGAEYTTTSLQFENKLLNIYTENNSGESVLVYHGDTAAFKATYSLAFANPSGQDIQVDQCNQAKYDYEGFNCFCVRFMGKQLNHVEPCMASANFPAVNAIFNLYYGFEKPRYFPTSFFQIINGRNIAFKLKEINFEAIEQEPMPHLDSITDANEITFSEFFAKTPELR